MAYSAPAVVCIVLIITNIVFVALRTWARLLSWARWTWADVLVPISLAINLTESALIIRTFPAPLFSGHRHNRVRIQIFGSIMKARGPASKDLWSSGHSSSHS
jgi:hypothetical protein